MTNRFLASLLAVILCLSMFCVVSAEEAELPYVEFTIGSIDNPDGFDEYPLVKQAKEKFNCDFTIMQIPYNTWAESIRTYAATGMLPEVVAWYDINYGEYKAFAEQGVLKALPDDMSAYPHLQENLDKMDVDDCLYIDGKLYCFPKLNTNQPVNHFNYVMTLYRRDWAKALGLDYAAVQEVTFDELVDFLRKVKEQDPGNVGEGLVPLNGDANGASWVDMVGWFDQNITDYYFDEDGSVKWGARDPEVLEGIKVFNSLYKEGLLNHDGYADTGSSVGQDLFRVAGRGAALYGAVGMQELAGQVVDLSVASPGFTNQDIGIFAIRMPDGKFHLDQMSEYWASFAFRADCSDEIMERFMMIGNWLLEDEQIETYAYGVKGVDWNYKEDGSVEVYWEEPEIAKGASKYYINGERMFQKFFMLEGCNVWLDGNPSIDQYLKNDLFMAYYSYLGEREAAGEVVFYPTEYSLSFISTPMKDQYGAFTADITSAVIEAVVADDPVKVWNDFLDSKAVLVDMVIAEIEEALAK